MHWFFIAISTLLAPPDSPVPECAGCHAEQAESFALSRHAVAWVNPLFRGEYDDHPKSWCVSCHAPDVATEARQSPPPAIAARGVSCTGCHRRDGGMVSRVRSPRSIHATRADPSFGRPADCASCHQFNFPVLKDGRLLRYTDEPMQNTVAEAAALGVECASCHDPHRAAGSHDVAMVRKAISSVLCRDGGDVVLTVANRGAGHNLPTGGVHRFIAARLWRSSDPKRVVTLRLGREFGKGASEARRTLVDTTIPFGGERELRAGERSLGGAADEPINAEIRYHYSVALDARLADGSRAEKTIERTRARASELPTCR